MKAITKTVTLTIDRCDNCPHFVRDRYNVWCKYPQHYNRNLTAEYDKENHIYLIPDWCKVEKGNGDGQHIPRNFEG